MNMPNLMAAAALAVGFFAAFFADAATPAPAACIAPAPVAGKAPHPNARNAAGGPNAFAVANNAGGEANPVNPTRTTQFVDAEPCAAR